MFEGPILGTGYLFHKTKMESFVLFCFERCFGTILLSCAERVEGVDQDHVDVVLVCPSLLIAQCSVLLSFLWVPISELNFFPKSSSSTLQYFTNFDFESPQHCSSVLYHSLNNSFYYLNNDIYFYIFFLFMYIF